MININISQFQASVNKRISSIQSQVFDEVIKAGNELRNEAVKKTPVKTGNLRASWQTRNTKAPNGGEVLVLNNANYWKAVEYGTRKSRSQPMIRPALKVVIPRFIENLRRI